MHFREPVISTKSKFLARTHVLVYGYWCCQLTILSAYNVCNVPITLLSVYFRVIMLSIFNNPSLSGLWIV